MSNFAKDRETLVQTFYKLAEMLKGDITALDTLSDDVIGVGLGEQGYYRSKAEIAELLQKSIKDKTTNTDTVIEYGDFDIRFSSEASATLNVEVYITVSAGEEIRKSGVLHMCSAGKYDGKWLFNLLTVAPLGISERSITSYPPAFADETLAKLRGELQLETFDMINKNFAGGVLDTYIKEKYPLGFANDTMIYNRFMHLAVNTLENIMDGIEASIYVSDPKTGKLLYVNKWLKAFYGKANDDFVGKLCYKEFRFLDEMCDFCPCHQLNENPEQTIVWEERLEPFGIYIRNYDSYIDWLNGEKAHLHYAIDITEINYDALTGVYNRRHLEENLSRLVKSLSRSGGLLSVMMIDIDFFKKYNDTYGHKKGDACLKAVAETITGCLSRADDFLVRYGGEEFAVILPNADESSARALADKLLEAMRLKNIPHEKNEAADCVTVSIGLTAGKLKQGQSVEEYIKRADAALYQSKQNGRNRYTYMDF